MSSRTPFSFPGLPFSACDRTCSVFFFFFFNDTATTEIYPLSLHDALPIFEPSASARTSRFDVALVCGRTPRRSEEHTSELQSRQYLVCRLLLEKKKTVIHTLTAVPRNTGKPYYSLRGQDRPCDRAGCPGAR